MNAFLKNGQYKMTPTWSFDKNVYFELFDRMAPQ